MGVIVPFSPGERRRSGLQSAVPAPGAASDLRAGDRSEDRVALLLVEDNDGDARLIRELLRDTATPAFVLTSVPTMSDALRSLHEGRFDAVLLDLALPDARGLDAVGPVSAAAREAPVVVLTGLTDETVGFQALACGAEDYLVKGQGDGRSLTRAILYAIERKRTDLQMPGQASFDPLTGLPNRRLFLDRARQALALARRNGLTSVLVVLDLDSFAQVNHRLGHISGDRLLRGVGLRLKASIRESDTVARVESDSFALLLPEVGRGEDVTAFAERLLRGLREPLLLNGVEVALPASAGISIFPKDAEDVAMLLESAEVALRRAKSGGKDTFRFFSPEMRTGAPERPALGADLLRAYHREELELHYLPVVHLPTDAFDGVEALLRWRHPQSGLLTPESFLPMAEQTGLILPIGQWALREACLRALAWQRAGFRGLRVSVNLSPRQIRQQGFLAKLQRVLKETGLDPRLLEIEVTEAALTQDPEAAAMHLWTLEEWGVRTTLDDFGGPGSSLDHLKRFPFDSLKIDRSFVSGASQDPLNASIIRGVVTMAHGMGIEVTAEGVESAEDLAFLREVGCDRVQGSWFGGALPAGAATDLLRAKPRAS